MHSNQLNHVDFLVSGAGITGLSYAWKAALAKKSVMIVCNRSPEFVRMQRIYLGLRQRQYLRSMLDHHTNYIPTEEDTKFLDEIQHSPSVALKDIEKYFFRNLCMLKINNFPIQFRFKSIITSLDFLTGKAEISSIDQMDQQPMQVLFTDVVGADGQSYHANSLVNQNLGDEKIIYLKDTASVSRNHFSVYFTLERRDGKEFPSPLTYVLNVDENNCYYAMTADAQSHIKSNKKKVKCFFVGELPASLSLTDDADKNKELILSHLKNLIETLLQQAGATIPDLKVSIVTNSRKYGFYKDKLKLLLFTMELCAAKKPIYSIGRRSFYLAGECLQNSNYQTGLRLNNILDEAHTFGEFLQNKKTKEEYIQVCQENIVRVSNSTNNFFLHKKDAVKQARKDIDNVVCAMKLRRK